MTISTEIAKALVDEAVKATRANTFLAGVILAYKRIGIDISNLIAYIKTDSRVEYNVIEKIIEAAKS